jgi:DNA-binding CsgD family transcriptional regulator
MISAKLEEALAALESSESIEELRRTMQGIVEAHGFAAYDFVDAGSTHAREPFHFGTAERQWENEYIANNFLSVDPCIAKARRTNTPFVWADLAPGASRPGPRSPVRRLMDAAQDFGLQEGLVVPCHFRDELGRLHSVSSVFFWKDRLRPFKLVLSHRKAELHLLMIYFIQRHLKLHSQEAGAAEQGLRDLQSEAGDALTPAQRDVLSWAARGKTVGETAEILKISDLTVETHVKNALRRLNVHNKTHAVAKAIMLGLIDY